LENAAATIRPVIAKLEAAYAEALGADWLKNWATGLPRWEETPGTINMPIVVWLWNLLKAFDMTDYARMRYNLLGNGGHWFPGVNAGTLGDHEKAISQKLAGYPYRDQVIGILREMESLVGGQSVKRLSQSD
jgi:predicted aldo/keto reductase-like oxidoreductase